jgi:hypothetical protein
MATYLTGFLINSVAIFILTGYFSYHYFQHRKPVGPAIVKPIVIIMILECLISLYFVYKGDLTLASIIVWVQAAPVLITSMFILLIIIFKPDWK